jgi:hypothetical protein
VIPNKTNVVSTIEGETQAFSIQINDKSFRVLLDGLYTDKPQSIVRELWTNALDSHIGAGIPSEPFHCQLPTRLDPTFSVRDYGTSMSHEDVMHLYSTVFASTKTGDNTQTGMLGLGSKSPFSYTDAFTVTAYSGSEKRTYLAAIGNDGIPAITLLSREQCGDPRGLEISFSVQSDDIYKFQTAADRVAAGFDVLPTTPGYEIQKTERVFEADGFYITHDEDSYSTNGYVRQGPVIYPIPRDLAIDFNRFFNDECDYVIDVPLGSVDFTASREALQMTDRTTSYLTERIAECRDAMVNTIIEDVSSASSRSNAMASYREWMRFINSMPDIEAFGTVLTPDSVRYILVQDNGPVPQMQRMGDRRGFTTMKMTQPRNSIRHFQFDSQRLDELHFVIDDGTRVPRSFGRFKQFVRDHKNKNSTYLLVKPTPSELMRLMRLLDLDWKEDFTYLKDLEDIPTKSGAPRSSGASDGMRGVYLMEWNGSSLVDCGRPDEIPEKFYWVPIDGATASSTVRLSLVDLSCRFDSRAWNLEGVARVAQHHDKRPIVFLTEQPRKKHKVQECDRLDKVVYDVIMSYASALLELYARPVRADFHRYGQVTDVWRHVEANILPPCNVTLPAGVQELAGRVAIPGSAAAQQKRLDLVESIKDRYPLIFNPVSSDWEEYLQLKDLEYAAKSSTGNKE